MPRPATDRSPQPGFRLAALAIRLAAAGTVFAAAGWSSSAQAGAEQARRFDIPAGTLTAALNRFAEEAGVFLSAPAAMTQGKSSAGLSGNFSIEQGFVELLRGQGLQAVRRSDGSYALRAAPAAAQVSTADTAPSSTLATVTVTASAQGDGSAFSPQARRTSTAAKTDTPNMEVPQAISVVTRDQIDEQGAAPALQDALRYTPGLIGTRGVNLTDDSFNVRGFAAGLATSSNTPVFRDGLRQAPAMYASTVEPYGIERIDVLRGPGSVLFGQVTPGGLINVVSKRPSSEAQREVNVQLGSHNHKQIGVDLGGKLDESGEWTYRLTAMGRDADTQTDYIPNDRQYVAPALTWRPSANTSLTVLASYQKTKTAYNWGLPVSGTVLPNPNGPLGRGVFTGEPGFDRYETQTWSLGYLFEHRFNDTWSLRQNARYYESDMIWDSAYGAGMQADQRRLNRFAFIRADDYKSSNIDTQVEAKWRHGVFEHTTLAGIDYADVPWIRNERRGTAAALDLFDPVYGSPIVPNAQPSRILHTDTSQLGLYLQEQVKINQRWVLMAGLRHDRARSKVNGTLTNGSATSPITSVSLRNNDSATTGRIGAVYLMDNGWAPYLSAATSYEPEAGALDFNNNPFKPTRGRQYEAGIKYESPDSPVSMMAAVFDLRRTNVLTADPDHAGYSVQAGEIRSRGLELEAKARLNRSVELMGAYSYTRTEITRSNNGDQGTAPPGVPRHNLSLWASYRLPQNLLPGVKMGMGVRRIVGTSGYVLGSTPTPAQLPAYTVFDAMISYDRGPWSIALNVSNLFDKTYVQSCYYGTTSCFYGDGRNAIVRATYRW